MGEAPIAVAVVSWNTRELLGRCLESLRGDAERGLAEVWVVDNASDDGSAQLVERELPWVRLIASQVNLGFGPAVNLVAARTRNTWLAAANADVAVRPDTLRELLEAGSRDPAAAVVAPMLVGPDGAVQHSLHRFPTARLSAVHGLGIHRIVPGLGDQFLIPERWNRGVGREADWAHGALLLLRRNDFERVGGFDESLWMYAEDLDLCWRLRRAGRHVLYAPQAVAEHHEAASTEQAFGWAKERRSMAMTYLWLIQRRGPIAARAIAALNVAGAAARLALAAVGRLRGDADCDRARWHARRYVRLHAIGLRSRRHLERVAASAAPSK